MFVMYFYVCEQVDGMDALAVKQACKFAKEHALKNGPIVSHLFRCFAIMVFQSSFWKQLLIEIGPLCVVVGTQKGF
jgi:hypothetical protein